MMTTFQFLGHLSKGSRLVSGTILNVNNLVIHLIYTAALAHPPRYTVARMAVLCSVLTSCASGLQLDEGDKLLEASNEKFMEQVDAIIDACGPRDSLATKMQKKEEEKTKKKSKKKQAEEAAAYRVQRCLFSATMPDQVEELARSFLIDPLRITVGQRSGAAATIKQELKYVGREGGKLLAMRQLLMDGLRPPILVFVQSKDRASELLEELRLRGWKADAIHAGLSQEARDLAMKRVRLGELWALVCTEVLARGIDLKHIHTVVNYDFPQTMTSYVHRIGRTGRAGREGRAITFFTDDDKEQIRSVAQVRYVTSRELILVDDDKHTIIPSFGTDLGLSPHLMHKMLRLTQHTHTDQQPASVSPFPS